MGPTMGKIEGVSPNAGVGLRIEVQQRINVRLDFGRNFANDQRDVYKRQVNMISIAKENTTENEDTKYIYSHIRFVLGLFSEANLSINYQDGNDKK